VPTGWRDITDPHERRGSQKEWHQALYLAGYVGMAWPVEYGGRGLSSIYDAILGQEASVADAPALPAKVNYIGRAMWTHGTEEQKRRFLPTLLNGDAMWCQGFSEPEAGSDIASLRTRGELEGDEWVVNGQKTWTSGADDSDWCFLLARTEPDAPTHKGITCLLVPMDLPGIATRPILLANGDPETAEVFFDDVRIPADQMLGERGEGWGIAMTTLAYERGPGDVGVIPKYESMLRRLEDAARDRNMIGDPIVRSGLARAYTKGEALRLVVVEQLSRRVSGQAPGSEGSIAKLLWTDAEQSLQQLALDILGADAWLGREQDWLSQYLWSRAGSVYGGSAQIQRNLVAQRLLGMPR
jgi:alkylation response protein AidB-like acyl-CoA dehydrogenase